MHVIWAYGTKRDRLQYRSRKNNTDDLYAIGACVAVLAVSDQEYHHG